jgi:hypothetical protein
MVIITQRSKDATTRQYNLEDAADISYALDDARPRQGKRQQREQSLD